MLEGPEGERPLASLSEELESLGANIDYINDSIAECQANIMQMEEAKVDLLTFSSNTVVNCWVYEKFMLMLTVSTCAYFRIIVKCALQQLSVK